MEGKIALEEHFASPETVQAASAFLTKEVWPELSARLLDLHGRRVELMDKHGIERMILSLNAPAVQDEPDPAQATEVARRANDYLAEQVGKNPARFSGFAALAMQDPDGAARELERCVKELGFKGAMVNGFSQLGQPDNVVYYDQPEFWPFWEVVEKLDVPFYLHPRNPLPGMYRAYEGHRWLYGAAWAFGQETANHALRLMGSGLFDKYPKLTVILGHLGEGIPFYLWRIDNRTAWANIPFRYPAKRRIADYFRENFYVTTSGHFHLPALELTIKEIGLDRVMFSADWPFENVDHAADWFDNAEMDEATRHQIGRTNALRLFGLEGA